MSEAPNLTLATVDKGDTLEGILAGYGLGGREERLVDSVDGQRDVIGPDALVEGRSVGSHKGGAGVPSLLWEH
jgi:hypothetical protein